MPLRSQRQPHPLAHTRSGWGSHAEDRVGAWGKGLDMPTPDYSWSWEGGWEGTGCECCEESPPTHTPLEPMPAHVLPCPAQSWCLRSPAPAGTSGAPARRPPPALESCCWVSCYHSRQLRLGGGAILGAGPQRRGRAKLAQELVAALLLGAECLQN